MKEKYAIVRIRDGKPEIVASRRTSDGAERALAMYPGCQIRLWKDGEWVRCEE